MKNPHLSCFPNGELCQLKNGKSHQPRNLPLLDQDLNFLPCSVSVSKGSGNQMEESCDESGLATTFSLYRECYELFFGQLEIVVRVHIMKVD